MKNSLKSIYLRSREFLARIWFDVKNCLNKSDSGPKVFCIGYNKTGTTTMGKAFGLLGYRNSSFNRRVWRKLYLQGNIEAVVRYTSRFESFDDLPWLREDMIPLLDQRFPGSRFVYLFREESSWKRSYKQWSYQVTGKYLDVEGGWAAYEKHRDFVLSYFEGRSDFIQLDIRNPNGFRRLGEFLGRDAPSDAFPVFNKSEG